MKKIPALAAIFSATFGFANEPTIVDNTQNGETPVCCACPHSHDSQEERAQVVGATEEPTDPNTFACGGCGDKGKN